MPLGENKSPAGAYGQWQNFSMGLQKLGGYNPNFKKSSIKPFSQEKSWADDIVSLLGATSAFYKGYEEAVSIDVDKYKDSHSLEEIQKEVAEKKVPFQNDPIAMTLFKRKMGQVYYQLADQEFNNRIEQGDYIKLTPEELDKEKFDFMRSKIQEIATDNPLYFANENDADFMEGFYSNSEKSRLGSMFANDRLKNRQFIEQSLIADEAILKGSFSDGAVSVEDFTNGIASLGVASGVHYSPSQLVKLVASGLDALASNPMGSQTVQALRNTKVAGLGNITYEDLLGGSVVYDKFVADSATRAITFNAKNWYDLEDKVNGYVANPTAENIAKLREGLNASLEFSGGVRTKESDLWHRSLELANRNLARAINANASNNKMALATPVISAWYNSKLLGEPSSTDTQFESQLRTLKIPEHMEKVVFESLIKKDLAEGDPQRVSQLMNLASRGDFRGVAVKGLIKEHYTRAISEFDQAVNEYVRTGVIPLGTDLQDEFVYEPLGRITGDTLRGIPQGTLNTLAVFGTNPSAFSSIMGNSDTYSKLATVDMALRFGMSPIEVLGRNTKAKDTWDKDQIQSFKNKLAKEEIVGDSLFGDDQVVGTNPLLASVALAHAHSLADKFPDKSFSDIRDESLKFMSNSLIGIAPNCVLPLAQIRSYTGTYQVTPDTLRDEVKEEFENYLKEDLKIPEDKFKHYLNTTIYDNTSNSILVVSDTSTLIGKIPLELLMGRLMDKHNKVSEQGYRNYELIQKRTQGIGVDIYDR